jgi:AraC family transcriptional regulator
LSEAGAAVTARSTIGWVAETASRVQSFSFVRAIDSSRTFWKDIAVEELAPARDYTRWELPAGHLVRHVFSVALEPQAVELSWRDGTSFAGVVDPGTVNIYPAHQPYTARGDAVGHAVTLQIAPAFCSAVAPVHGRSATELKPVFGKKDPFLAHAILALHDLARDRGRTAKASGEAVASGIAGYALERYGARPLRRRAAMLSEPLDRASLLRIDQFIQTNLDRGVSVCELAGLAEMDVFHFSRQFKLATGEPPHRYLLHKRIERAKSMLRSSCGSLAEVALACGFASHSHFTDVFGRRTGATPRQFRGWARRHFPRSS